jgi:hypothetical protein
MQYNEDNDKLPKPPKCGGEVVPGYCRSCGKTGTTVVLRSLSEGKQSKCYYCESYDVVETPFASRPETVDHPAHYGGENNPYEHIKVCEAWGWNYHRGNATKYICRAGKKNDAIEDLEKAAWYLNREIERRKKEREDANDPLRF